MCCFIMTIFPLYIDYNKCLPLYRIVNTYCVLLCAYRNTYRIGFFRIDPALVFKHCLFAYDGAENRTMFGNTEAVRCEPLLYIETEQITIY